MLIVLCCTHDETQDYTDDPNILQPVDWDKDMDLNANTTWIEEIISRVTITTSEKCHENAFHCGAKDKNMFVKLFSSIVLWSNIMNPVFGSSAEVATSSDVESYFKSLKNGILKSKTYRVDEFFKIHTDFVNSEIKLNAMSGDVGLNQPAKRKRTNSLNESTSFSPGTLKYIVILIHHSSNTTAFSVLSGKPKRSNSFHENLTSPELSDHGKLQIHIHFGYTRLIDNVFPKIQMKKTGEIRIQRARSSLNRGGQLNLC